MVERGKYEDRTIHTKPVTRQETEQEVAQRAGSREPKGDEAAGAAPSRQKSEKSDKRKKNQQTSGYGVTSETRENPEQGPMAGQSGTRQAHERPGVGNMRDDQAMSQNGARISDFEG